MLGAPIRRKAGAVLGETLAQIGSIALPRFTAKPRAGCPGQPGSTSDHQDDAKREITSSRLKNAGNFLPLTILSDQ